MRARTGMLIAVCAGALALALGGTAAARPSASPEYQHVCSHALPHGVAGCDSIKLLHPAVNWHGSHTVGDPSARPEHPNKGPRKERPKEEETPTEKEPPSTPAGYGPAELQSAYGLGPYSGANGAGRTVAIVDAYNDPNAGEDLNVYREKFGLGTLAECTETTATACFEKVNQTGGSTYPQANSSWAEEISLDLDMVSAICPSCKILLVEATSNSMENLGKAAAYAAGHANAVSNSYGGSEFSGETGYDRYYSHPGVAVTVSSGDGGYGVEYPAASPDVTAVGGTTLSKASNTRGWTETVWSGSGAGCSTVEPNPGWQPVNGCAGRTVADTSADANPNTGVAVYDSYGSASEWMVFGGTSVASPIVASVYALAENTGPSAEEPADATPAALYGDGSLNKVQEGTDLNPHRCGEDYLCNAKASLKGWSALEEAFKVEEGSGWYNGPTGNGTPNGTPDGLNGF